LLLTEHFSEPPHWICCISCIPHKVLLLRERKTSY